MEELGGEEKGGGRNWRRVGKFGVRWQGWRRVREESGWKGRGREGVGWGDESWNSGGNLGIDMQPEGSPVK